MGRRTDEPLFLLDTGEGGGASSAPAGQTGTNASGGATDAGTDPELEGLPLHLHPRGKELVAQKNAAVRKAAEYERLGAPEEIAQKLAQLAVYADIMAEPDKPEPKKPATQDEVALRQQREWAREQLLDLLPEIKDLPGMKERLERGSLGDVFYTALEEEAMDTTVELAEEIEIAPQALAEMLKPIMRSDRKLLRQYNAGKAEQAVRGAYAQLKERVGGKKDDAAKKDTVTSRAADIKATEEVKNRLPKTHTQTGTPIKQEPPAKPKNFEEARRSMERRLEKAPLA